MSVLCGSQADEFQGTTSVEGKAADGFGDIFAATNTKYVDDKVVKGSHDPWGLSGTYLRAVFVKSNVADPMEFVLNAPMVAIQSKEALGCSQVRKKTGDAVDCFVCFASAFDMVGVALDAEDLTYIREIQVLIEAVADPDFALFNASVVLVDRSHRRGKKTRCRGPQCGF